MQEHPIHALSDQLVEELCDLSPEEASYAGVPGRDHLWGDLSPQGGEDALAALRTMLSRVEVLPPATNRWDQLAIDVALDYLQTEIEFYESSDHLRQLNSISSPLQGMREVFDHMSKDTVEGWDNIATRLETLGDAIDGYIAGLDAGLEQGLSVPIRQAVEGAKQARVTASDESQFRLLANEYTDHGFDDDAFVRRLDAAIDAGRAAFGNLASYLTDTYAKAAPEDDAAGFERYSRSAYRLMGTRLDLEETYTWAWTEIASLRERMETEAAKIVPGGSIEDALHVLKTDPERAAADPKELKRFLEERLNEALDRLSGTHFHVPDEIRRCDVKIAPPGASLVAYYVQPSEDFSRPGSVWWSIDRSVPTPLYDNVTTAYHEGFPGHHLQCGIQVGLEDKMTRLQRVMVWQSGSGEGWALYAERLMDELGFLDTPDYVFGFLSAQMLRACRVVIDIGSHLGYAIPGDQPFHPGEQWAFDTAVEMLQTYATLAEPYAVSEVIRYLGWPAQAISYKVGERTILDIRRQAEEQLGSDFDPKVFHQRLLEVGPIGLDLVRHHTLS